MVGLVFQSLLLLIVIFLNSQRQNVNITVVHYILVFLPFFFTVWLTHKHIPKYYQKKPKYVLAPFFKAYIIHFILSLLVFKYYGINRGINRSIYSNLLQSLVLYYFIETAIYFFTIKYRNRRNIEESNFQVKKYQQKKYNVLKTKKVDLSKIDEKKISFPIDILQNLYQLNKTDIKGKFSVDEFPDEEIDLFIVNKKVNNLVDINLFFNNCHQKITIGGYLIIGYNNLEDIEEKIRYSKGIRKFIEKLKFYLFDRAFPKLPVLNKIHLFLTKGKNKVISRAEVWGRLLYHGFDVKKEVKNGDIVYLIAQKDRSISKNPNPSYAPLIRLNRVSLYGNIIKIYKIRSMYPYSEFLQEKVYEMNSLTATGKFNEDFRITKLGKLYRKYWIDETPQFLDLFRGSVKLVGIRAMSLQFFNLYSTEYQELFYQVKPGIISPIFDEKTDSFEDIQKIEKEYLELYLKNPIITDFKYFFKTLGYMLKGVRSK